MRSTRWSCEDICDAAAVRAVGHEILSAVLVPALSPQFPRVHPRESSRLSDPSPR